MFSLSGCSRLIAALMPKRMSPHELPDVSIISVGDTKGICPNERVSRAPLVQDNR
jgi:hypothetical protein